MSVNETHASIDLYARLQAMQEINSAVSTARRMDPYEVRGASYTRGCKLGQLSWTIGEAVTKKLDWKQDDKANVLFDNRGVFITRDPQGRWTLRASSKGSKSLVITVGVRRDMPDNVQLKHIASQPVKYHLLAGGLLVNYPEDQQ